MKKLACALLGLLLPFLVFIFIPFISFIPFNFKSILTLVAGVVIAVLLFRKNKDLGIYFTIFFVLSVGALIFFLANFRLSWGF